MTTWFSEKLIFIFFQDTLAELVKLKFTWAF